MTQQANFNRRNFLKTASAATIGALAAGDPGQILAKARTQKIEATADAMIVLWMGGGMAHTETFDPKRYTPYEKGLSPDRVLSSSAASPQWGPTEPAPGSAPWPTALSGAPDRGVSLDTVRPPTPGSASRPGQTEG